MIRSLTLALVAFSAVGCGATKPNSSAAMDARPLSVQAPGALADAPAVALSSREFTERVHDLERRGKSGAAARLAALYPDLSRAALESVSGKPDPSARSLASAFDRAIGAGDDSWSTQLTLRLRDPARFVEYDAAHAAVLDAFARGNIEDARESLPLPVPADVPGAARLRAVSDRLVGLVALAEGNTAAATAAFDRPHTDTALFSVLALAAAQRAADAPAIAAARDAALLALVEGGEARPRRREPALLERALGVDDAPEIAADVARQVRSLAARDLGLDSFEDATAAGWAVAGLDRLARSEARTALTDLRRAEEGTQDSLARARLREAQARALLALGEPAASRAILGVLAGDADPRIARPALATLGAIELRLGRPELAAGMLRRALAEPVLEWPGASAALANLGLALISAGIEEEGLKRLAAAQARFELERDYDALAQALDNERLAHERAARSEELADVRARIAAASSK